MIGRRDWIGSGICLAAATAEAKKLSEAEQVRQVLAQLHAEESYVHFFTTEAKFIRVDAAYEQARNAYFIDLKYINPTEQNPIKQLKTFMQFCKDNGKVKTPEQTKEFEDAAWVAGMRLITDKSSFPEITEGVEKICGLTFAKYDNIELQLDLFLPQPRPEKPAPCIVCIHGGGWRMHRRPWFAGHAAYFASRGFAAVAIDYRKVPAVTPLECTQDAKAAVRWVRANAAQYGIDPKRIGAVGGSAGAHLSAILATSAGVPELEGSGGNASISSAIQAAVGYATPSLNIKESFPEKRKNQRLTAESTKMISPYEHIDQHSAPLFFIHGSADKTVPLDNSLEMHAKYQQSGAHSELKILEGKGHVFYTNEEAAEWAYDFFAKQFGVK